MEIKEVVAIYERVVSEYRTNMYTQEELGKKLGIPLEAVQICTSKAGFWHTKAKEGVRGVYYEIETDPDFARLKRILERQ